MRKMGHTSEFLFFTFIDQLEKQIIIKKTVRSGPIKTKYIKSWTLTFQKIFAKLKFSPVLFEKKTSIVCLVFKNENK